MRPLYLFVVLFFSIHSNAQVLINEALFDPAGADGGITPGEWVELYGTPGMNIGCYVVTDGDYSITIPKGTKVPATGYYLIGSVSFYSPNVNNSSNTNSPPVTVSINLNTMYCNCVQNINKNREKAIDLNNAGEYVALFNPTGGFVGGVIFKAPSAGNLPIATGLPENIAAVTGCSAKTIDIAGNAANFTNASGAIGVGFQSMPNGSGIYELYENQNNATPGTESLVLPIELVSFKAYQTGQEISLNWETAREENNDYFSIERSTDIGDFAEVGRVLCITVKLGHS